MKIELLQKKKKKGKLSFFIKGVDVAFMNTLRRLVVEEVPVMAADMIEVRKNSSALYDEVLAHRIGLVPLKTDLKSYNLPEECPCKGEGCAQCQLKMTLKVKGPKMVFAEDIQSKDPKVGPVYPQMPLVKLLKDQEVEMEITAQLGQGKIHQKWSPGHAYYAHKPVMKVDEKKMKGVKDIYPPQIFKKGKVDENALFLHPSLVDACKAVEGPITITHKDDEFIMFIESWGQLDPETMVRMGVEMLNEKLDALDTQLRG